MAIFADASALGKRRIPVRVTIPASSGPMTLVYPRWLPGSHSISGTLENVSRLAFTCDGRPLEWRRDPYDAYVFRLNVPKGGRTVEAAFDYVPPAENREEVFYGVAVGRNVAVLNPSAFALAPEGDPRNVSVTLRVRLPKNWTAATALTPIPDPEVEIVAFAPASLYTLIDSPIIAGAYHKTITLPVLGEDVPHALELFAESEEILKQKEIVAAPLFARLVAESGKLFGVRHYHSFQYLLALSADIGRNGLEHHECSLFVLNPDDLDAGGKNPDGNKKPPSLKGSWNANLIPHEYVHSWNGKFRRPYGENPKTNTAPQSADLIWVYEGLTEYLGEVLMVRAGFRSFEDWRKDMAPRVVDMRLGPGRDWQSLADAATAAGHTYVHGSGTSLRSTADVYYESALIWLEADAIIRRESKGTRSLDDFCRIFFGGPNRGAEISPYVRKDVLEALNKTQSYNWNDFIETRFYGPPKGFPADGLEAAGWKFVLGDAPEDQIIMAERDLRSSLGFRVANDGRIFSLVPDSPADRAGVTETMTLLGANGFRFTPARLREAVKATKDGKTPLVLLLSDGDNYRTARLDYASGERFPSLARDPAKPEKPDLLALIAAPAFPPK